MQLVATSLVIGILTSLTGCVTGEPERDLPGCNSMECVSLGEAQEVGISPGDLVVTPVELLEDSRCPVEAECIWAGQVRVKAELQLGHEVITAELTTENPMRISGGMLSIGEVAPEASTQWMPIPADAYRFGFRFAPDIMEQPQPGA